LNTNLFFNRFGFFRKSLEAPALGNSAGISNNAYFDHFVTFLCRAWSKVDPELLRLIGHESLEPGADVGIADVDVVLLCDSGRAVAHQFGERVPIHATLDAARAECVPPTVERASAAKTVGEKGSSAISDI
jgi:hypothetical protein